MEDLSLIESHLIKEPSLLSLTIKFSPSIAPLASICALYSFDLKIHPSKIKNPVPVCDMSLSLYLIHI